MKKLKTLKNTLQLLIGLLFVNPDVLWANISNSFSGSIPFLASGRFVFDTLDYLTTPFLYNVQTENVISLKFTRINGVEGLFGASRVSIFGFPL